jgi:hypothetical protein
MKRCFILTQVKTVFLKSMGSRKAITKICTITKVIVNLQGQRKWSVNILTSINVFVFLSITPILPYYGEYKMQWCIIRSPLFGLKISEKKALLVYYTH